MSPLGAGLNSYSLLVLLDIPPLVFKAEHCGRSSVWYRSKGLMCPMCSTILLLLREKLHICEVFPNWRGGSLHLYGVFGETLCLHLLPVSVWSFHPLLWQSCWASFQIFFRRNYFKSSCVSGRRQVQDFPLPLS